MDSFARILFVLLIVVAIIFIGITVVFGSKSDAMSGGSSQIRTTFRGKAGFDDQVSKMTLILGVIFMSLALAIDIIQERMSP